MTWLIWFIRSWFCKHSFLYNEKNFIYKEWYIDKKNPTYTTHYTIVSATCKHCGWHKSYEKF